MNGGESGKHHNEKEKQAQKNYSVADVKKLILRLHPDRFGGESRNDEESPGYWAGEITRLLNNLRDSEQTTYWHSAIRDEFSSGRTPRVRLVRSDTEGQAELSPEIDLPRYAQSFLNGLESFLQGNDWETVLSVLRKDPRTEAADAVKYYEQQFKTVSSLEDARGLLTEFINASMPERTKDKLTGRFSLLFAKLYDRAAKQCSDLRELANLKEEAVSFLMSNAGSVLSMSEITITLDMATIDMAKEYLSSSTTSRPLPAKWTEIAGFPFSAPDEDLRILAEIYDEIGERMLVKDLKRKRTIGAIDALRLEIQNFQFQSLPEEARQARSEKIQRILESFVRVYGQRLKQHQTIDKR